MSEKQSNTGVNVFQLPDLELRKMIQDHAASAQACISEITAALPPETEREAPVQSQREVYLEAIKSLELRRDESMYLADHLVPGNHPMSAAELLAFKRGYGALKVDLDRLKWAPMAAPAPNAQAERRLTDTLVKVPRLVMPNGSLVD